MSKSSVKGLKVDQPGRGRIYDNILETIGNTPLIRVAKLAAESRCQGDVLIKLESSNPISSVKDRIAIGMLETLEAEGKMGPGSVVVEPTSGNTGVGLAFACAAKGYRCILTMPDSFSIERRKLMQFLGAELVLTPAAEGIHATINKAKEIVANTENAVMPWQFGNPANPETHRRTTAEEIWNDTDGKVDAVVICVGTGGTLTGVGEGLKKHNPNIKVVAVEPENSPILSGGTHGPHQIQGIGTGFIPDALNVKVIDEVMLAGDEEAIGMSQKLAKQEGIPVGISSGAALACALRLASRDDMKGKTIVTLLADSAERYISTKLFEGYGE